MKWIIICVLILGMEACEIGQRLEDWLVVTFKRMTREGFRYQYSLHEAESAGKESLFFPVELSGNIEGALGVFTCYTIDSLKVK